MAAASVQVGQVMPEWELFWSSGGKNGTLFVHAPDAESAIATVKDRPWRFGLNENPIVGCPTWIRGERRRHAR